MTGPRWLSASVRGCAGFSHAPTSPPPAGEQRLPSCNGSAINTHKRSHTQYPEISSSLKGKRRRDETVPKIMRDRKVERKETKGIKFKKKWGEMKSSPTSTMH